MENSGARSRSGTPPRKTPSSTPDLESIKSTNPFEYYIKKIFLTYDADASNALDHAELRKFLDELRQCLNLLPADDSIFYRILENFDDNQNG